MAATARSIPTTQVCSAFGALALAACAPPQIVVALSTDLAVPSEIDRIEIAIDGPNSHDTRSVSLAGEGAGTQPLTLTLRGTDGALVDLMAVGFHGASPVVTRRARARFVRGRVLALPLALRCGCGAEQCGASTSCEGSHCADGPLAASELDDWHGLPDATAGLCTVPDASDGDGGARDAGTRDGAPPVLGRPVVGAIAWPLTVQRSRATPVTPTTNVTALRIAAYVDGFGADAGRGQEVRAVLYASGSSSDTPGPLLCQSESGSINIGRAPGWYELILRQPCLLDAGRTYFVGLHSGGPNPSGRIYYDTTAEAVLWYSAEDLFADGPADFVAAERDNRLISIYAVVAPR